MTFSVDVILVLIVLLSAAAAYLKLLTPSGGLAACIVGAITLIAGGIPSVVVLFVFFAASNALGFWRRKRKQSLGFEKGGRRDHLQVLANGGPAVIGLLLGAACQQTLQVPNLHLLLFSAGLAEAASDTWATEIGSALNSVPRSIVGWKLVPPGRSGGVTMGGSGAAAAGALFIGIVAAGTMHFVHPLRATLTIGAAGIFGAFTDSVLGATVQAQYVRSDGQIVESAGESCEMSSGIAWLRNDGVNFLAGLSAVAAAALISRLLAIH